MVIPPHTRITVHQVVINYTKSNPDVVCEPQSENYHDRLPAWNGKN